MSKGETGGGVVEEEELLPGGGSNREQMTNYLLSNATHMNTDVMCVYAVSGVIARYLGQSIANILARK